MEADYVKRLVKRLNERRAKHALLVSKRTLELTLKVEIQNLEADINNLDNKISVLTPTENST